MYEPRTPYHLREDASYGGWKGFTPEQKEERQLAGLPVPVETKGEKLYQKAKEYLESKGFMNCDMGNYFPEDKEYGSHGLGLAIPKNAIAICFVHGETFEKSPYVDCSTVKSTIETIDLLISACSLTEFDPN